MVPLKLVIIWLYQVMFYVFSSQKGVIMKSSLMLVAQVTPNLYGTLVANTAAGIAGGTGVMPGGKLSF